MPAGAQEVGRQDYMTMLDGRATLRSGRCSIRGSVEYAGNREDVLYEMTFDTHLRAIRLQNRNGGTFVRNTKFQYALAKDGRAIRRMPLAERPETSIVPFDMRGLGFLPYPAESVYEIAFLDYENLMEYLLTGAVLRSRAEGSVRRLTVRIPRRPGDDFSPVYRFWIDTKRGHTLVRFEQLDNDVTPPKALWWSELDWKRHRNVWVPIAFRQEIPHATPFSALWEIEWKVVNEPIDPREFELEKLVPPGKKARLYVMEKPSNRVVSLGMIEGPNPAAPKRVVPRSLYFNWAKAMYVSGIVLIIIAGLVVMGRKWRR